MIVQTLFRLIKLLYRANQEDKNDPLVSYFHSWLRGTPHVSLATTYCVGSTAMNPCEFLFAGAINYFRKRGIYMIQILLINYLFGGSLSIMGVFLTMVGLVLTTGYVKALKSHTWVSSNNLKDLFTKFVVGNNLIRDNKSYSFSCYDKIFVIMIRKLGGLLNNHSDYLTFNYEKEKSVMVMVFNSHFMLSISWF